MPGGAGDGQPFVQIPQCVEKLLLVGGHEATVAANVAAAPGSRRSAPPGAAAGYPPAEDRSRVASGLVLTTPKFGATLSLE
jgi:hypothetical protein